MPELSIVVTTRFAAVSSSGVLASCGSSADCIGRTMLAISATPPASVYDEPDRAPGEDRRSGRSHEHGADERDHEHDALAPVPVAEQAGKRRRHEGRQHANEPDQADRRCAPLVVRIDGQGYDECPIRGDRESPGRLDTQQARIRENGLERVERLSKPLAKGAQHRRRMTPAFAF